MRGQTLQDSAHETLCIAEEERAAAQAEAEDIRKRAKMILLFTVLSIVVVVIIVFVVWLIRQPKYKDAIRTFDATASCSEFVLPRVDETGHTYVIYNESKKVVDLPAPSDAWINTAKETLEADRDTNYYNELEMYVAKFLSCTDKLNQNGLYNAALSAGQGYFQGYCSDPSVPYTADQLEAVRNSLYSAISSAVNAD